MLSDTAALDDLPGGMGRALPLALPLVLGKLDALTDEQLAAGLRRAASILTGIADGPADVSRETLEIPDRAAVAIADLAALDAEVRGQELPPAPVLHGGPELAELVSDNARLLADAAADAEAAADVPAE